MDTEYTAPNGELREAYNAVINSGAGRVTANDICIARGATPGMHAWRRVPSNKAKACRAALEKLAGSQPKRAAPPQSYGENPPAEFFSPRWKSASPHRLQSGSTRRDLSRWNAPKEKTED